MGASDQMHDDLAGALRDLSDAELAEEMAVCAHLRNDLDAADRPRLGRLYAVLAALCAGEKRRRRAEVKVLEATYRAGEDVAAWWGSPDVR